MPNLLLGQVPRGTEHWGEDADQRGSAIRMRQGCAPTMMVLSLSASPLVSMEGIVPERARCVGADMLWVEGGWRAVGCFIAGDVRASLGQRMPKAESHRPA